PRSPAAVSRYEPVSDVCLPSPGSAPYRWEWASRACRTPILLLQSISASAGDAAAASTRTAIVLPSIFIARLYGWCPGFCQEKRPRSAWMPGGRCGGHLRRPSAASRHDTRRIPLLANQRLAVIAIALTTAPWRGNL